MHWVCFHYEFEHDDSDPDLACGDPSCPSRRIDPDPPPLRLPGAKHGVRRRFTFVTLGARDLRALRAFYGTWTGAGESPHSTDDWVAFELGDTKLCLWPMHLLREEAASDRAEPDPGAWNGITLAFNVAERGDVDALVAEAVAAGASLVAAPTQREWGGYSGYVADPEGNRWEIAWAPDGAAE